MQLTVTGMQAHSLIAAYIREMWVLHYLRNYRGSRTEETKELVEQNF